MTDTLIKLRRSTVPGKIPTDSQLQLGEVAINTYDGKMFFKQASTSNTILQVATTSFNLGQFATTTSAQLASVIVDDTGTGSLVFNTSPTLVTPAISGNTTFDSGTLFVDSVNNRVGVNTISPSHTLHVVGNARITGGIADSSGNFGAPGQLLASNTSGTYWVTSAVSGTNLSTTSGESSVTINSDTGSGAIISGANTIAAGVMTSGDQTFAGVKSFTSNTVFGTDTLFIDTVNKRVGVGTVAPTEKFHVQGTTRSLSFASANGSASSPAFDFAADPNTGIFLLAADTIGFATNGSPAAAFTSTGDLRLYNTTGTRHITFANQPTANVVITVPVLPTNSSFVLSEGNATVNGTKIFTDLRTAGPIVHTANDDRDKLRVWSSSQFTIGMSSPFTFGPITNNYAMTFQMSDDNGRGFWWGDSAHGNNQGAMALSTDGRLTVATALRVGYGENDNVVPSTLPTLDITGNMRIAGLASDGHWINFVETGTNDRFGIGAAFSGTGDSNRFFISTSDAAAGPNIANAAVVINQDRRIVFGSDVAYGEAGVIPRVQIAGTTTRDSRLGLFHWQDSINSGSLEFNKSRSSTGEGKYNAVQNGDHLATFVIKGSDGSSFTPAAYMFVDADANATLNKVQSRFEFWTTSAQNTGPAQRVIIGGGGIGLDVNGTIRASTGILFGTDTADANTLDDYEEGSWSPVISDGSYNAVMNATVTSGQYIKVGRHVTCMCRVSTTSLGNITSSSLIRITGLPFAVQNTNSSTGAVSVGFAQGLGVTAGYVVTGRAVNATSYIQLFLWDSTTGTSPLLGSEWSADGDVILTATYLVA